MEIITFNYLNQKQVDEIQKLEKKVKEFDKTHRNVYLSTQFNVNQDMPAFFMAYSEEELIGFLAVYADELPKGTFTVFVHPNHREQGVSKKLISKAISVVSKYGITEIDFYSEKVFMENNSKFKDKWIFNPSDSELLLNCISPKELQDLDGVTVRRSTQEDVEKLAEISSKAFENTYDLAKNYIVESLKDENIEIWTILLGDKIVGSLSIDISSDVDFFFGVAISPDFQGKGIGKSALFKILKIRNSEKIQQLQVEITNQAAIKMYRANGFEEISEIRYITVKN